MDAETWELLLAGQLEPGEMPDEIDLPELTETILDLWLRSIARQAEGVAEEWAALLVRDETGALRMMNPVVGTEFAALPDYGLPLGTEFVGTFHTHPRTDGLVPMPFSAQDFISALALHENVSLLLSDGLLLALVRTTATAELGSPEEVKILYARAFQAVRLGGEDTLTAAWSAVWAVCLEYHWGLYVGWLGQPMKRSIMP